MRANCREDVNAATDGERGHQTSELQIALLNAAELAAETSRNFRRELDGNIVEFHCPSGEIPDGFGFDAVVVTGSWASVYWDREWIGQLKEWIGEAVRAGIPTLGVCFGHQLLADVLGGQVEAMGETELGYRRIEQDGENQLLGHLEGDLTVFTSHGDHVTTVPPGATVFAWNEFGVHGFRKEHVFAVQFHPEYDLETARCVTERKDDLPPDRIESVLAEITPANYRAARPAAATFDNFLGYVTAADQ